MIEAGQAIGSYRILQKIGTGGMGAVFLAEHPLIGKRVALKVIHRELANNKEVVQRFFQEAQAVTKIGSEHIVSIHDFGQTPDGDHFYIMEYLEGQTLAQVLGKERVLDVMRAMHIGAQIGAALGAAHASGVVHRDLKPDNVMLTMRRGDPDFVVLLDFGLAKVFQAAGQSAVKTAAGVLLGTPQYMSPEACESRSTLDHRTDVYALGILLFQMMTGMLPFDGESMGEVLVKQVTQLPPPPRQFNSNIPPSVEQIVLRCLAKSPDARFQSMTALRDALRDPEAYLHMSPPMAPARSLAPGEVKVDGKMVMAYAAAAQAAKNRTGALPAIPVTPPHVSSTARTMMHDGSGVQPPRVVDPAAMTANMPKMNTMRIATPAGYSSRPPRRMWPIVLVASLVLGLGGGAFAVAWFGRGKSSGAASVAGDAGAATGSAQHELTPPKKPDATGSAAPTQGSAARPTPGAGSAAATGSGSANAAGSAGSAASSTAGSGAAPRPAVPMAVIVIDSVPPGAEVIGPDKTSHGKTPARLSLPISDMPLEFELRLAGYRKKTKQLVVGGNTVVQVTLDPMPVPTQGTGKGSGKGTSKGTGKGTGKGSGSAKKPRDDTLLERPD